MSTSAEAPEVWVGRYRLLHRLGEGGMGVVHLAEADGHRVALKVLRPHVVGDDEARQRLAREVNSLSRVRSPRVAEIIDADPWGPIPFVATRYVPGLSLYDHVRDEGLIAGDDLVHLAGGLAAALRAVHLAGVLHRDIKPSNVLMEGRSPVLIDFGLARVAEDDRLTRTGWLLGTPGYLAPEILYGDEPTPAADVHSWAATVAYAGTGRAPYGRGPSMAVMDRVRRGEHDLTGLEPRVRGLLEAALHPEPARRPDLLTIIDAFGDATTRERIDLPAEPTIQVPEVPPPTRHFQPPAPTAVAAAAGYTPTDLEPEPPVKVRFAERMRRWLLGLALLAGVSAAVAAAPWAATATLVLAVAVLRWLSVAAFSAEERRRFRGRKWYDGVVTAVTSPVDLVASIPGTALLLACAGSLVASAALVMVAAGVTTAEGLPLLGAFLGLCLWWCPGGRRVRSPVGRIGAPLARSTVVWAIAVVLLLGAAAVLAYAAQQNGADWTPAEGAPWRKGTLLDRYVNR
jgi:hypothetical protein